MPSLLAINILDQPSELESVFCHLPTKLSIGGNIGVAVGPGTKVGVGGIGVCVGKGVFVGKAVCVGKGVFVGKGVDVGGTGVETGAHPLNKTDTDTATNARNTD